MYELIDPTNTLLSEIKDKIFKQKDVAMTYALALKSSCETNWARVNKAIIHRWSHSALKYIKELAHKEVEGWRL